MSTQRFIFTVGVIVLAALALVVIAAHLPQIPNGGSK